MTAPEIQKRGELPAGAEGEWVFGPWSEEDCRHYLARPSEVAFHRKTEKCGDLCATVEIHPEGTGATIEGMRAALESLLRMVNPVTAAHRHGQKVPAHYLTNLANRQIEVEEKLRALLTPTPKGASHG